MHDKVSNKASKLIKSLQQKKYRDLHGLFVVEGVKSVGEAFAAKADIAEVVYTGSDDFPYPLPGNAVTATEREMAAVSSLKTPNRILAVCRKAPEHAATEVEVLAAPHPAFALDGVSDPGNLGTIIRICDWFGMPHLICDSRCVDVYNPKTVQASMGSIFRVAVHYTDLAEWLKKLPAERPVFTADMNGDPIGGADFGDRPVVILGSEAHGISEGIASLSRKTVSIPRIGGGESLNVAVSAAIFAAAVRKV